MVRLFTFNKNTWIKFFTQPSFSKVIILLFFLWNAYCSSLSFTRETTPLAGLVKLHGLTTGCKNNNMVVELMLKAKQFLSELLLFSNLSGND